MKTTVGEMLYGPDHIDDLMAPRGGCPAAVVVNNATCPSIPLGTTGKIGHFRRDGSIVFCWGTDPSYKQVIAPSCVERV